ncbi:putative reverse transcriptase domain-containing protein [Tanacetum coccineum]
MVKTGLVKAIDSLVSLDEHFATFQGYGYSRKGTKRKLKSTKPSTGRKGPSQVEALVDAVTAALPSPPLPPLLPPLYIPLPVDHRDDIPESEQPPRKRSCLFALGSWYEVGESSTARPTRGQGEIIVPEIVPITMEEVNTRVIELAELHEHDTQDLYALLEDAQDSRTRISQRVTMDSQRVNLLMEDKITLQETATHYEIQTHREQVYAHESQLHAHQTQLQLQGTLIQTQHQIHETRFQMQQAEMAKLQETNRRRQAQMVETLRVIRDMRRKMGDMQAELLALREQRRRARQPAPDARVKFANLHYVRGALTGGNGQDKILGLEAIFNDLGSTQEENNRQGFVRSGEIKKLETELWNLKVKGNDVPTYTECFQELTLICTKFVANETEKVDKYISGLSDNIYGNDKSARPKTLDETIELANDLMDQKLCTYAERQTDNKRKADDASRNNHGHQQQPFKRQNVAKVYNMGSGKKKRMGGSLPKVLATLMLLMLRGTIRQFPRGMVVLNVVVHDIQEKKGNALRDPDSNVVTGTFLLNNRYASILFDTGADGSFISTAFSSLIDIAPTPLENSYDVGIKLRSFDVIIGMDWLRRCHIVIVCDERLVRIPYRNETLIFFGNESSNDRESRLTIISCSKAQEYMAKGCQIFLAQVSAKKEEDKSEGKQLKDVPIVQDFSEVFLEDLSGLPPARPVKFQIDLIPGAAPVARSPYRLVPSEMKELSEQLQELSDKAL